MTTEHTVVRSGKSKRKPFNSNVADYLLIIATFGLLEGVGSFVRREFLVCQSAMFFGKTNCLPDGNTL
jgi:hypothetical protein